MKTRRGYIIAFFALLLTEICIGAFAHDRFIRPYVGDVLVAVLLCCGARVIWTQGKLLPLWVFAFCAGVETLQLLVLPRLPGLEDTLITTALGSTFDLADLVCYAVGSGVFWLSEGLFRKEQV